MQHCVSDDFVVCYANLCELSRNLPQNWNNLLVHLFGRCHPNLHRRHLPIAVLQRLHQTGRLCWIFACNSPPAILNFRQHRKRRQEVLQTVLEGTVVYRMQEHQLSCRRPTQLLAFGSRPNRRSSSYTIVLHDERPRTAFRWEGNYAEIDHRRVLVDQSSVNLVVDRL